ncbi:rRNA maturation RNase YbeY [Ovoidimarina sediminis]|uniref:rRNA maturation RNase YbeY n=1 Tax=Ovoidimarina sediminis TaxID=3079856 RepID=UPI0029114FCB|nr:rRNA maturation RNase YbeY [Rhodophyticola sp. MJ-SS7]MDU8942842.1 rRNA maturation RNase YbeY [Rhodophyticola sp. MJ-SS7]
MIDVVIEDPRWQALGLEPLATRAVAATLTRLGLGEEWEVVCLGCDDARIAALNADFRGKPRATNVLSWPSAERAADRPGGAPVPPDPLEGEELGDIALAYDTCAREAAEAGLSLDHHTTHLIVHGVLHLLGYDHESEADAALMEGLEVEILATLGVSNPY